MNTLEIWLLAGGMLVAGLQALTCREMRQLAERTVKAGR